MFTKNTYLSIKCIFIKNLGNSLLVQSVDYSLYFKAIKSCFSKILKNAEPWPIQVILNYFNYLVSLILAQYKYCFVQKYF